MSQISKIGFRILEFAPRGVKLSMFYTFLSPSPIYWYLSSKNSLVVEYLFKLGSETAPKDVPECQKAVLSKICYKKLKYT